MIFVKRGFSHTLILRKCFQTENYVRKVRKITKEQLLWYPGHINKGINQMHQNLHKADIIVEIHDARIPFTGRTELMNTFSQVKPRIVVFNKVDLIPKSKVKAVRDKVIETESNKPIDLFFTQLNDTGRQHKLLTTLNNTIVNYITTCSTRKLENFVLVAGLPNVGKSTFINGLRNWTRQSVGFTKDRSGRPTRVGSQAGVTRHVSERILLCDGPPRVYMLDSPGVWEPRKENVESMLKLALCGCLNFDSVDKEVVVDFMLYWMNGHGERHYVDVYGLSRGPTDNVIELLLHICANRGFTEEGVGGKSRPAIVRALELVFDDFSKGVLGKFVLDDLDLAGYMTSRLKLTDAICAPLGSVFGSSEPRRSSFPFVWASK